MDTEQSPVKSVIHKREVQFFIVTDAELNDVLKNTILGHLMLLLCSVYISLFLEALHSTPSEFKTSLLVPGLIFVCLWVWFSFSKPSPFRGLSTTKFVTGAPTTKNELEILSAIYGTSTNAVEVAERLQGFIKNGVFDEKVTNQLIGQDPHIHKDKTLKVVYRYNGIVASKEVKEYDRITLP